MDLKVEYIYGDMRNVKQNIIYINADINEKTPDEDIDFVLIPLISQKTEHENIKIYKIDSIIQKIHIDTLFN